MPAELWLAVFGQLRGNDFRGVGSAVEGPAANIPGADRFSFYGNSGLNYGY
jgi:hypothetical protein